MISLPHQTRIAINLVIEDDTGRITEFLMMLTALIGILLRFAEWVKPVVVWAGDFLTAASFTAKIVAISFNALAFGLGVRL